MSSKDTTDLIDMYHSYGLSEPFAMAIVEGKDPKVVMEFWNQDWHKQYPDADDVLVIAVLEQTITPEEGEWLNSVRSNHEAMVLSCLDGSCTIEWAKSLMDAGFLNHSKEVSDILKGGDPIVIGMLSGIALESDLLPPKLEIKIMQKESDLWDCPKCHNDNFAWRTECKMCGAPKAGGDGPPLPPGYLEKPPMPGSSFIHRGKSIKASGCLSCNASLAQPGRSGAFLLMCPNCGVDTPWRWERLSEIQKLDVGIFMSRHFRGITFLNRDALDLMYIIAKATDTKKDILTAIEMNSSGTTLHLVRDIQQNNEFDFRHMKHDLEALQITGRVVP